MLRCPRYLSFAVALLVMGLLATAIPASAVLGGQVSTYGPWAVSIMVKGEPECTGTAITREWILTASHCFLVPGDPGSVYPDSAIEFRVGSLDRRTGKSLHPLPGTRAIAKEADMELLKVAPMNVTPATLPGAQAVEPGQTVREYGWGATCHGDETTCQSPVLKQVDVRTVDPHADADCHYLGGGFLYGLDFCMRGRKDNIAAGCDSGGPVMSTGAHGRDTILGVIDTSNRADHGSAGIVSTQLRWIHSIIDK